MKNLFLLSLLFVVLFSCSQPEDQPQALYISKDSLIPQNKLADYMVEIFLIEAAIYKAQHDGKNVHDYATRYYSDFFARNNLTKNQLTASVEYYVAKKQMEFIVQNVVSQLTEIDLKIPEAPAADTISDAGKYKTWMEKMIEATRQDE